jgi:ribosomal protein S18 acetylase RimI-like enzyme
MNNDTPAFHIRPARSEDAEAMSALGETAQNTYQSLLPSFFRQVDRSYWHTRFLHALELKDYYIFVVEPDSRHMIAGYIELFIKRTATPIVLPSTRLLIDNIVVAPEFRRHGIGTQLLGFADDFARHHAIDTIELQVAAGNTAAMALYEQCGFGKRSITMEKKIR